MTIARAEIIHPSISRYYHCIARCVRHSFLCGEDRFSGRNFDHRKGWLVDRMKFLSGVFAIDICAYAVMSNHYHLVLHWNIEQAQRWSDREVVERWCELYSNALGLAYLNGEQLLAVQRDALADKIQVWRSRLQDISWYMRCLNEYIARKANQEDECTGHFWQNRFRSQALMDEGALLSCMAYVDLNPIRAGMCERLDESDFTSIQDRLRAFAEHQQTAQSSTPEGLLGFVDETAQALEQASIPYLLLDYFQLVDWTGRSERVDKRGSIPAHVPALLRSLGLDGRGWLHHVRRFQYSKMLKVRIASQVA